jgi:hypothetical protein
MKQQRGYEIYDGDAMAGRMALFLQKYLNSRFGVDYENP